jgi:peptidase E
MHKKVAVEKNLNNVRQYFESQGYQVDLFNDSQLDSIHSVSNYDAIIVSGGNIDFMGIQDTETRAPIINATGISPQAIFNTVSRTFE